MHVNQYTVSIMAERDSSFRFASFGMTTFIFEGVRRERRAAALALPLYSYRALSFRALARNLHLKLLDFVVITVGV